MKKYLITFSMLVALGGCAQIGHKFDITKADDFQPGVTTVADAKAALGEPISIEYNKDGDQALKWMFSEAGITGARASNLILIFDKDGKMLRVRHRAKIGS